MNGFPDLLDCINKINSVPDLLFDTDNEYAHNELSQMLAGTIAHFQSPPGKQNQTGGTGRLFVATAGTRVYDGNGYPELTIDDVVPGNPFTVSQFSTPLSDVELRQGMNSERWNVIFRPQLTGGGYLTAFATPAVFPYGPQNIWVTATFGAGVTADIYEAVRGEVAFRYITTTNIGVNGVGEMVQISNFEISTAVGAMNWTASSPIALMRQRYLDCVMQYQDDEAWKWKPLSRRMS
jgi:hypothetical protein